jgi:hypothetical protein
MGLNKFSAKYRDKSTEHNVNVGVFTWNDDKDIYYAYSPALDLSGYGKNKTEAIKSFETAFFEFVKYTSNKNTLFEELEHLGWTINRKKKKMIAPSMTELLEENETFRDVFDKPGVELVNKKVELAAV